MLNLRICFGVRTSRLGFALEYTTYCERWFRKSGGRGDSLSVPAAQLFLREQRFKTNPGPTLKNIQVLQQLFDGDEPRIHDLGFPGLHEWLIDIEHMNDAEVDFPDFGLIIVDQTDAHSWRYGVSIATSSSNSRRMPSA